MYLYDSEKKTTKTVMDDGTYIIKNNVVIGRWNLENGNTQEYLKMKTKFEPLLLYICKQSTIQRHTIRELIIINKTIKYDNSNCKWTVSKEI